MYPEFIKTIIDKSDLATLDKMIDSDLEPEAKYWAYVAKGDLIRKMSPNKSDLTVAFTLYDAVLDAKLPQGKSLPTNLLHHASFGKAILMVDAKHNLPRGAGDKDTALALLHEIVDKTEDQQLTQEAQLLVAKVYLQGTTTQTANYEFAENMLSQLMKNGYSQEFKTRVTVTYNQIKKLAEQYQKRHDFLTKFASTPKQGPRDNGPIDLATSKADKMEVESPHSDVKETTLQRNPKVSHVVTSNTPITQNAQTMGLPFITLPPLAPTQFFNQPSNLQQAAPMQPPQTNSQSNARTASLMDIAEFVEQEYFKNGPK